MTIPDYSTYFSCLYNEPYARTDFGKGVHCSVMRAVEWLDVCRIPLKLPEVHDFAVIWDQDHDERVIRVIERIYMAGLLSPVQFVGEHNATFTVIVAAEFRLHVNETGFKNYIAEIQEICSSVDDEYWAVRAGMFDRSPSWPPNKTKIDGIIPTDEYRAVTYLRNLDNVWQLGPKTFIPTPRPQSLYGW